MGLWIFSSINKCAMYSKLKTHNWQNMNPLCRKYLGSRCFYHLDHKLKTTSTFHWIDTCKTLQYSIFFFKWKTCTDLKLSPEVSTPAVCSKRIRNSAKHNKSYIFSYIIIYKSILKYDMKKDMIFTELHANRNDSESEEHTWF